jgi:hypothetical protein
MTRPSSLTDAKPAPELDGRPAKRLERLEFGKFCVDIERRPVERNRDIPTGYSQLGWSAGFPEELISSCHPKNLGISEGDSDPPPPESPHGTVLRPALMGAGRKRLRRVFYRVQMRAEDGEGGGGRRYTMARYLVADDDVDPLMLLNATDSLPLWGLTRREASEISVLEAQPADLKPSPLVEAFLRRAVTLILSGVPLSITEELSEQDFFSCVAALWRALPPALQPYLSAGWGVGSSYSGRLAVTRTSQRAPDAALFSPAELRWSLPDSVTTWDENYRPVRSGFFRERLRPGWSYTKYVFERDGHKWSVGLLPPPEKVSSLISTLPSLKLPELPDWRDNVLIRAFRSPGLKADDHFVLKVLERWLRTGDGRDDPRFCLDARQFIYEATRLNALDLMIKALAYPVTRRGRGDRALWRSLSDGCPESFVINIQGARGLGAHRARLLSALAGRDTLHTLGSLLFAAQHGEAESLPDEVGEALRACLDDSIRPPANINNLHAHSRLLKSPPGPYRQWLRRRGLHLMRAMASAPDAFGEEVYRALIEVSEAEDARALYELIKGDAPSPPLASYVGRLPPEQRDVFIEQFNQEWLRLDENVAERRERLLGWFDALGPKEAAHPLLRLAAGAPLSAGDAGRLADEVEQSKGGYVPPSLAPEVAAFVLINWAFAGGRMRARAGQWRLICAEWPPLHERALVGGDGDSHECLVRPNVLQASRNMLIPLDDLNDILRERITLESFGELAPLFWDWAMRLTPRPGHRPTAVDFCWYLTEGKFPEFAPKDLGEIDIFARLAQKAGMADELSGVSQRMWAKASEGWQLLLLLSVFREVDFKPSAMQLERLIEHRERLDRHLSGPQSPGDPPVHGRRLDEFYLATVPFHGLSYREHQHLWREEFATLPVIWAAFSRVPLTKHSEGSLRPALRAYSGSHPQLPTAEQSFELREQQALMCLTFLRAYEGPSGTGRDGSASQSTARSMVLFEFVFPLLRHGRSMEDVEGMFDSVGSDLGFPDYARKGKRPHWSFSPRLYELLAHLLGLISRKEMMTAISEYYKARKR